MTFYDLGRAGEVAVNLFHGYGYNFYRAENQLRADDQLARTTAAGLLGQARAAVDAAESAYRREHIPSPTRANPFPPAEAVAAAQAIERLAQGIGALEGRVRAQPAPANDRMTQLYRREADTLARLIERDKMLVGEAELLREAVAGADGEAILAKTGELKARIEAIAEALRERGAMLV